MECPNCGQDVDPKDYFCGICRTPLNQTERLLTDTQLAVNTRRTQSVKPPPLRRKRRIWCIVLVVAVLMLIIVSGVIIVFYQSQTTTTNANAPSTANAHGQTQTANNNSTATVQAHLNATTTAQAKANANATATAAALPAIPPPKDCVYKYWSTSVNTRVTLTNFGIPTGCVLVSDSVQGEFTREDIANSTPVDWSQGGVMAFPEGVYSGFIYNGEYETVPKTADPTPKQVFCNRVYQVVTNHYAFFQAQPLPEWGLPLGKQIVAQGHC